MKICRISPLPGSPWMVAIERIDHSKQLSIIISLLRAVDDNNLMYSVSEWIPQKVEVYYFVFWISTSRSIAWSIGIVSSNFCNILILHYWVFGQFNAATCSQLMLRFTLRVNVKSLHWRQLDLVFSFLLLKSRCKWVNIQALLGCRVTALQDKLVSWFSIAPPHMTLVLLTVGFQTYR